MEQKKKDLLRRLTIISIPILFVAVPSIIIWVSMSSPHAARFDRASVSRGYNYSVAMMSTMTGGQMILSCRAEFVGNWEYFHYFILNPYKPRRAYFRPQDRPYIIYCNWRYTIYCNWRYMIYCNWRYISYCNWRYIIYCNWRYIIYCNWRYMIYCNWRYMGNFAQNLVVFNSNAPYAEQCRWANGGCRYSFRDGQMFLVTGKRKPRPQDRKLVGDLPLRQCKHVLGIFPTSCHLKPHSHEYVGQPIGRMQWWFNY